MHDCATVDFSCFLYSWEKIVQWNANEGLSGIVFERRFMSCLLCEYVGEYFQLRVCSYGVVDFSNLKNVTIADTRHSPRNAFH